jgi:hypothetical protein
LPIAGEHTSSASLKVPVDYKRTCPSAFAQSRRRFGNRGSGPMPQSFKDMAVIDNKQKYDSDSRHAVERYKLGSRQ